MHLADPVLTVLFDRGTPEWGAMFWDGRVQALPSGHVLNPTGDRLPTGLDSGLAAQSLFSVTSADEMRGAPGKPGNELSDLADEDVEVIWGGPMARLRAILGYRTLFAATYPGTPAAGMGFQHASNAIAAFEVEAFTLALGAHSEIRSTMLRLTFLSARL